MPYTSDEEEEETGSRIDATDDPDDLLDDQDATMMKRSTTMTMTMTMTMKLPWTMRLLQQTIKTPTK